MLEMIDSMSKCSEKSHFLKVSKTDPIMRICRNVKFSFLALMKSWESANLLRSRAVSHVISL